MAKRLYRSITDSKIAGLCGGIAEYFDTDPTLIRLLLLALCLITGVVPLAIFYLLAWWIVPEKPATTPGE